MSVQNIDGALVVTIANTGFQGPPGPPGPQGSFSPVIAGNVNIFTPDNITVSLMPFVEYAFSIVRLDNLVVTAGTISVSILVNGLPVSGLSSVAVTAASQSVAAGANTVNIGDEVSLALSGNNGASGLKFSIKALTV